MSHAWEVTGDDVSHVLHAHDKNAADIVVILDSFDFECERVEDAILYYDNMEDQVVCMYSEIEDSLIEDDYIDGPKLFSCP